MKFFTSEYTEKNARYWAAQRELGRWKYILLNGVVGFGCQFFTLRVAWYVIVDDTHALERIALAINIPTSLLAGLGFGLWMWHLSEKSYAKYMNLQIIQDSNNEETSSSSIHQP